MYVHMRHALVITIRVMSRALRRSVSMVLERHWPSPALYERMERKHIVMVQAFFRQQRCERLRQVEHGQPRLIVSQTTTDSQHGRSPVGNVVRSRKVSNSDETQCRVLCLRAIRTRGLSLVDSDMTSCRMDCISSPRLKECSERGGATVLRRSTVSTVKHCCQLGEL